MIASAKHFLYLFVVLFGIIQNYVVQAGIYCGNTYCAGSDAYCCYDSCCWHTVYVYELWWFWFIWFMGLMLIISCVICIRRRRMMERTRYIRVVDGHPAYGTTVTTAATQYQAPPPPAYGTVVPNAPAYPDTAPGYPPQYHPQQNQAYMSKPPAYQ